MQQQKCRYGRFKHSTSHPFQCSSLSHNASISIAAWPYMPPHLGRALDRCVVRHAGCIFLSVESVLLCQLHDPARAARRGKNKAQHSTQWMKVSRWPQSTSCTLQHRLPPLMCCCFAQPRQVQLLCAHKTEPVPTSKTRALTSSALGRSNMPSRMAMSKPCLGFMSPGGAPPGFCGCTAYGDPYPYCAAKGLLGVSVNPDSLMLPRCSPSARAGSSSTAGTHRLSSMQSHWTTQTPGLPLDSQAEMARHSKR